MSFLAAHSKAPQSAMVLPQYTGLQLQTATNTLPIPIVYGMTKLAPNVIFYENFHAIPQFSPVAAGGKGGVFGRGAGASWQLSGYTYAADLMLALCEGPIQGVGQVWQNSSVYGAYASATETHAVPASAPYTVTVSDASAFYLNASVYYASESVELTQVAASPSTGQYTVSEGVYAFSSGDANASVSITYEYSQTPTVFSKTGLQSVGLTLFNGAAPQALWGYLSANYPQQALSYPGIAYVCAASFNLGSSASIGTLNLEVQGRFMGTGANGVDADPAQVIADFLTNPQYGVGFPGANIDATTVFGGGGDSSLQTYCKALGLCFSPALNQQETAASILQRWMQLLNLGPVWSGSLLRFIPYGDENVTGNGATWVAPTTLLYQLSDADLVYTPDEDPIKVSRVDPFTLENWQWLEALDRAGVTTGQGQPQYQATPVSAHDQAMIEEFGLRVGAPITAHEICDLGVAQTIAQTILQRRLYVRAQFKFALSWEFCLLDPMDVVTLTDANLGLFNTPVRIIEIEEDDNGLLSITAEELIAGVSTPARYQVDGATATGLNTAIPAAPVNMPLIYEPPPQLTGNVSQLWLGASGGRNGVADPNWGGCFVWASLDNISYQNVATINNPLRQGSLTAPLPSATGYDAANVLSVNLSESGGVLVTSTQAAAQAGQTLCLVDNELIGFTTATLTASHQYNLFGLQRGMYGAAPATHALGAPFARLDDAVAQYDLPANFVGKTLYLKFQSFNVFGGGAEDISTCAAFAYEPNGGGAVGPVATSLLLGQAQDWGQARVAASVFDDFGTLSGAVYARIDLGSA